jgi:hypothetical protein
MSETKVIEMKESDEAKTRQLCFVKLRHVGEELLPSYWVVRDGQAVSVAREALTLSERRVISETLKEMGEEKIRESDALRKLR